MLKFNKIPKIYLETDWSKYPNVSQNFTIKMLKDSLTQICINKNLPPTEITMFNQLSILEESFSKTMVVY